MKYKTTKKAVNAGYAIRLSVGYCNLQFLLSQESPVAYTARREGWAADIYNMGGGVAIVTGYDPFGNVKPDYNTCRKYDQAAQKIRYDYSLTIDQQREALRELIDQFLQEVTGK